MITFASICFIFHKTIISIVVLQKLYILYESVHFADSG